MVEYKGVQIPTSTCPQEDDRILVIEMVKVFLGHVKEYLSKFRQGPPTKENK
jgi:hypothetical protein